MKKKKTIAIKDSRLRGVRDNLRNLWKKSAHTYTMQLLDKEKKIYHNKNGKYKPSSELTGEEIEAINQINDELINIRNIVDKSICKCRRCARSDQDMTYNPRDGAWYCVECYEEIYRWTAKKKTGRSILFP